MIDPTMSSFLEACGSTGPLFLGVQGPEASDPIWRVLDQPFAVVGRAADADVSLPGTDLSRRHAYLQLVAGRLFCVDLGSRTGTHWARDPGPWGWVDADAAVQVGPHRLWPRADRATTRRGGPRVLRGTSVPVSRSFEQAAAVEVELEIRSGSAAPTVWRVSRSLVLMGRSPGCKIRLDGTGIANIHASLVRTPTGLFVVDLLGPAGILVNGRRARWARLEVGDELGVGEHSIRVRDASTSAPGAAEIAAAVRTPERPPAPIRATVSLVERAIGTEAEVGADRDRALVKLMVAEVAESQQLSVDRFQDTLMAVVRSFVGMQQEQMNLIREELSAIRRLNEEHRELQAQVDRWEQEVPRPAVLRLVSGEPDYASSGPTGPSRRRVIAVRTLPARGGPTRPGGPVSSRTNPGTPPSGDGEAFHARVFDRLEQIQGERQSRWQRLKESVLGKDA